MDIERYNYAFDPEGDALAARVLRRLPETGSVLELGPGPGAMTRVLVDRGHPVTVVERDPQALPLLAGLGVEVIAADLEDESWIDGLGVRRFDAILACDVLEHLYRPARLLERLEKRLEPMGRLLISVPNIAYAGVAAALRNGAFEYADSGLLDRTHVHFFTRRSMEAMLLDTGWLPLAWEAYRVPIAESEFAWCWDALAPVCREQLQAGWTEFDVYEWVVMAVRGTDVQSWTHAQSRSEATRLRDELHALKHRHAAEHASLLEHQKAFAEARELIARFQQEIADLKLQSQALVSEKEALQVRLQGGGARRTSLLGRLLGRMRS